MWIERRDSEGGGDAALAIPTSIFTGERAREPRPYGEGIGTRGFSIALLFQSFISHAEPKGWCAVRTLQRGLRFLADEIHG